nr:hypothetical protein [Paracoccus mutanolyticus]
MMQSPSRGGRPSIASLPFVSRHQLRLAHVRDAPIAAIEAESSQSLPAPLDRHAGLLLQPFQRRAEAFDGRELRGLDATVHHPPFSIDQFKFDQPG